MSEPVSERDPRIGDVWRWEAGTPSEFDRVVTGFIAQSVKYSYTYKGLTYHSKCSKWRWRRRTAAATLIKRGEE